MGTAKAEGYSDKLLSSDNNNIETNYSDQINQAVMSADTSDLAQSGSDSKLQNMAQPILENNYIDKVGIAVGSLPKDMLDTVRVYAKHKFPNMDINQAIGRFGQENGRIYYLGTDQNLYWATPDFSAVKSDLRHTDDWMSKAVGPAIPIGAGTVAGVTGTVMSGGNLPVGVMSAVAGGGSGEVLRQTLAHKYAGENMSMPQRVGHVVKSSALEGAGQTSGHLLTKVINKVLQKLPARIGNLKIGEKFNKYNTELVEQLDKASKKFKIKLTSAEISKDPQLIKLQKVLAGTTGADEILEAFYNLRNKDIKNAVFTLFNKFNVSATGNMGPLEPVSSSIAYKNAIKGSRGVIEGEKRILLDSAKAFYNKAYEVQNVNVQSTINLIDELAKKSTGNQLSKLLHIKNMLYKEIDVPVQGPTVGGGFIQPQKQTVLHTSLETLDHVKREIDQILNVAGSSETSISKAMKPAIIKVKSSLLSNMDDASPHYAKARSIYEEGMPNQTSVEKSILGMLAKQNEHQFYDAGKLLFSTTKSSPLDVKLAREMFEKHGKINQWNQIVGAHLEDAFQNVLKEETVGQVSNLGGLYYKAVFGTGKKRAIMMEAMKGTSFGQDFADLMTLLNQTSKAMKSESMTHFFQTTKQELLQNNKPVTASVIELFGIIDQPKRFSTWWTEIAGKNASIRMAKMLTTPNGRQQLAKLRELGINSKAGVIGLVHILKGGTLSSFTESSKGDVEMGKFNEGYK